VAPADDYLGENTNMRRISLFWESSLLATLLVGSHNQAYESEMPRPLGKMYDVGGHKMHLYATGKDNDGPSVILEAEAGAFSRMFGNFSVRRF
jgi:hypothetical protein